jgi:hypothetical protein
MDWGTAPAWVAIIVSAVALWNSHRAGKTSTAEARRSADASERSAAVAEEALAEQRLAADQERVAAAPKVKLALEAAGWGVYRLRNIGLPPCLCRQASGDLRDYHPRWSGRRSRTRVASLEDRVFGWHLTWRDVDLRFPGPVTATPRCSPSPALASGTQGARVARCRSRRVRMPVRPVAELLDRHAIERHAGAATHGSLP